MNVLSWYTVRGVVKDEAWSYFGNALVSLELGVTLEQSDMLREMNVVEGRKIRQSGRTDVTIRHLFFAPKSATLFRWDLLQRYFALQQSLLNKPPPFSSILLYLERI